MADRKMARMAARLIRIAGMLAREDRDEWAKSYAPLLDKVSEMMKEVGWEPGDGTNSKANVGLDRRSYNMDDLVSHCFLSDDQKLHLAILYKKIPRQYLGTVPSRILTMFTKPIGDESGYDAMVRDLKRRVEYFLADRENHSWTRRLARQLVRIARLLVADTAN